MPDIHRQLRTLRRPKLLLDAAKYGLKTYKRTTSLKRYLGGVPASKGAGALSQLMTLESEMEATRLIQCSSYSAQRHIGVLTALLSELTLLPGLRAVE